MEPEPHLEPNRWNRNRPWNRFGGTRTARIRRRAAPGEPQGRPRAAPDDPRGAPGPLLGRPGGGLGRQGSLLARSEGALGGRGRPLAPPGGSLGRQRAGQGRPGGHRGGFAGGHTPKVSVSTIETVRSGSNSERFFTVQPPFPPTPPPILSTT